MNLETLKEYTIWLGTWAIVVVGVSGALSALPIARDNTDEKGWFGARSGMVPMTDQLTGCQYLRVREGGITPRLGTNGSHIGCGQAAM